MSTSNQAIASAFNAATGMGGSSMTGMLSFGTLALIIVFFTASALLALGMMMRNANRQSGMDSWFQLLFILCGISLILLFFSLL